MMVFAHNRDMEYNDSREFDIALTITAGAYSANDVVGGLITIPVATSSDAQHQIKRGFPSGVRGIVRRLIVHDDDNERAAMKLHLFKSAPATIADNAAFAPTFADLQKRIGQIDVATADYSTINSNAQAIEDDLALDFTTLDGNLYAYLVCNATPTYTATTDLSLSINVWIS